MKEEKKLLIFCRKIRNGLKEAIEKSRKIGTITVILENEIPKNPRASGPYNEFFSEKYEKELDNFIKDNITGKFSDVVLIEKNMKLPSFFLEKSGIKESNIFTLKPWDYDPVEYRTCHLCGAVLGDLLETEEVTCNKCKAKIQREVDSIEPDCYHGLGRKLFGV